MPHRLLLLSRHADQYHKLITAAGLPELEIVTDPAQAEIVFAEPILLAPKLAELPRLLWAQSIFAGVEPLMAPGLRQDYRLTNAREVFGPLMAEYTFGYLLWHERQMLARWHAQREHRWDNQMPGRLQGKTLGLLGVGSIGAVMAHTARAFGMRVLGYTRSTQNNAAVDAYYHGEQWPAFAAQLDYLVATLPATPATRGFLNAKRLAALPPRAVLVNAGRGSAMEDAALVAALRNGQLAAAILDVTQPEPLPAEHPFWDAPNLTLTFHTSAPSFPEDLVGVFIDNYRRYQRGEALRFVVDFAAGY